MPGFIHGHAWKKGRGRSPTYNSWRAMKRRCSDPSNGYCQRGITHDPRWASFECFLSDMGLRPPGCDLSRVDPDGPYNSANCFWESSRQNRCRNRGPAAWA